MNDAERAARAAVRTQKAVAMGHRVRVLRTDRRLTQAQLSERTGLSKNYLSGLELGRKPRPRGETLERLAAALGVTVEQLGGKAPLPGLLGEPEGAAGAQAAGTPPPTRWPDDPEVDAGAAADGRGAFAFAGLLPDALGTMAGVGQFLEALPPDVVVMHHRYPDGSLLLYIRLPHDRRRPPTGP